MSFLLLYSLCHQTQPSLSGGKDNELLSQAISLSLESDVEEKKKFKIQSFQNIQTKLHFLPSTLSTWYPDEYTLICMRPRIDECKIQI